MTEFIIVNGFGFVQENCSVQKCMRLIFAHNKVSFLRFGCFESSKGAWEVIIIILSLKRFVEARKKKKLHSHAMNLCELFVPEDCGELKYWYTRTATSEELSSFLLLVLRNLYVCDSLVVQIIFVDQYDWLIS